MEATRKASSPGATRVLEIATTLFANHGYHGVSTRRIAEATGLNVSTVHHHVGGKRDLYVSVIEHLYEAESRLIQGVLRHVNDDIVLDRRRLEATLVDLIDHLMDHAMKNPARQRLYVRRWLEAPDDLRRREAELTLKLYSSLRRILERGQELNVVSDELDIGYFLRSVDWMIMGYFTSGAFSWKTLRDDPQRARNLLKFKRHLISYMKHMLEI